MMEDLVVKKKKKKNPGKGAGREQHTPANTAPRSGSHTMGRSERGTEKCPVSGDRSQNHEEV